MEKDVNSLINNFNKKKLDEARSQIKSKIDALQEKRKKKTKASQIREIIVDYLCKHCDGQTVDIYQLYDRLPLDRNTYDCYYKMHGLWKTQEYKDRVKITKVKAHTYKIEAVKKEEK